MVPVCSDLKLFAHYSECFRVFTGILVLLLLLVIPSGDPIVVLSEQNCLFEISLFIADDLLESCLLLF